MDTDQETAKDRIPRIDIYGFERPEEFDYAFYEGFHSRYLEVLTRRAIQWSKLMQKSTTVEKSLKVKRYIRKGIPNEHRSHVWMIVSGAQAQMELNPGYYHRALVDGQKNAKLVDAVVTDLNRTFPDNVKFRKNASPCLQQTLHNVLVAYGHHNKAVGYCQGMNFITGYLILVTKDEERAFWLLDALIGRILPGDGIVLLPIIYAEMLQCLVTHNEMEIIQCLLIFELSLSCPDGYTYNPMHVGIGSKAFDYYSPAMIGLKTDQEVLGDLVKMKIPDVAGLMERHGVMWTLVVSRWFICLFIDILPVETVLRIWDCLFYEGSKVIFRVALTLIKQYQAFILEAKNFPDVCDKFKAITKGQLVTECHLFMQKIFTDPGSLSRTTISKLREKHRSQLLTQS